MKFRWCSTDMPSALKKIDEFDYKLERERDDPAATVFRLRPLTSVQAMEVAELQRSASLTAARRMTLFLGLRGWTQFLDPDGSKVPFSGDPDANLARFTVEDIVEIATAILDASKVTESERKN